MVVTTFLLGSLIACGPSTSRYLPSPGNVHSPDSSSEQEACLTNAGAKVAHYLTGTEVGQELEAVLDCVDTSLQEFTARTQGSESGSYTSRELTHFLQTYFLNGSAISEGLFTEATLFKKALFGGDPNRLTLKEIELFRGFLSILKREAGQLRPFMPLSADAMAKRPEQDLIAGAQALREAALHVGEAIESVATPYSLSSFEKLLVEFVKMGNVPEPDSLVAVLLGRLPLIRALKAALIDHESNIISGDDWKWFLVTASDVYSLHLMFRRLDTQYASLEWAPGRFWLYKTVGNLKSLLEASMDRGPKMIPLREIDALIDAFAPGDLPITQQTLKDTLRPLLANILTPVVNGVPREKTVKGLTRPMLDYFWTRFTDWTAGQRYLERLYEHLIGGVQENGGYLQEFNRDELLNARLEDLFKPEEINGSLKTAAARLRRLLAAPTTRPLFRGSEGEISFDGTSYNRRFSRHDLSQKNWMQVLSETLLAGYRTPSQPTAGYSEFRTFYSDVHALGVEIKFFLKEEDATAMAQRFREANLFTFAGNGDDRLDSTELSQLLAFMVSAKRLTSRLHREIALKCASGGLDVWGEKNVSARCFREEFFARYEHSFALMPRMADHYGKLSTSGKQRFRTAYEKACLGKSFTVLNSALTQAYAMVPHYVEAMFLRFDSDFSGALTLREGDDVFQIFGGAIRDAIRAMPGGGGVELNDEMTRAVFTYLLAHGTVPKSPVADILWWEIRKHWWNKAINADRGQIINILGAFSDSDQAKNPNP